MLFVRSIGAYLRPPLPLLQSRSAYGSKKLVRVWNKHGQEVMVDIRDAGKKKYSRTPPDSNNPKVQPKGKLRGRKDDPPEVQFSKTLSWLLRHGAQGEGLGMRPDGYVRVRDLVSSLILLGVK